MFGEWMTENLEAWESMVADLTPTEYVNEYGETV